MQISPNRCHTILCIWITQISSSSRMFLITRIRCEYIHIYQNKFFRSRILFCPFFGSSQQNYLLIPGWGNYYLKKQYEQNIFRYSPFEQYLEIQTMLINKCNPLVNITFRRLNCWVFFSPINTNKYFSNYQHAPSSRTIGCFLGRIFFWPTIVFSITNYIFHAFLVATIVQFILIKVKNLMSTILHQKCVSNRVGFYF